MASAARLDATNCILTRLTQPTYSAHSPLPRDGAGGKRKVIRYDRLVGASYTKTRLVYGIRSEAGCNQQLLLLLLLGVVGRNVQQLQKCYEVSCAAKCSNIAEKLAVGWRWGIRQWPETGISKHRPAFFLRVPIIFRVLLGCESSADAAWVDIPIFHFGNDLLQAKHIEK